MFFRISRDEANNFSIALFLLLVLFVPNTNASTRLYFATLLLAIPFLLGSIERIYFDYLALTGVAILVIHVFFTALRFGFIVDPNLRDYTEFARLLLPVLMLIFRDKFKDLRWQTIFAVFAFYILLDFFVSLLEFLGTDFAGLAAFAKSVYVSGTHVEAGFRISGLSAGPAQHGIKLLVIYTFFYCRIFQAKKIALPVIFSILTAFPLFLTQSRTSMIALAIVSVGVGLFYLFFGSKSAKVRSFFTLSFFTTTAVYLLIQFQQFFKRLYDLLKGIEAVTSYQDRVEGYKMLFDRAMEHPAFLTVGYGKNFFRTSVFDNEYILMFLVYGPIISLAIIIGVFTYLITFIFKNGKTEYEYGTMLFFLLVAGLVIAYPATFFLQTSIIPLLLIFINLAYWENVKIRSNIADTTTFNI